MGRQTWVQDPRTGKLIPKEEYVREGNCGAAVIGDIDPFISPITGAVISSRSGLRVHNAEHGVTDSRDYSSEFMLDRSLKRVARMQGRTTEDKADRIESIKRELERT